MNLLIDLDLYNFLPINLEVKGYNASDFYLKIPNKHLWEDLKEKLWGREHNESLVKCIYCDLIALSFSKDNYEPEIYNYYARYPIESKLTCFELVIKNIIE